MNKPLGSVTKRSKVKAVIGFITASLFVLGMILTAGVAVGIICQVFMMGWYLVN